MNDRTHPDEPTEEELDVAEEYFDRLTGKQPQLYMREFMTEATKYYHDYHGLNYTDFSQSFHFVKYEYGYSLHLEIIRSDLGSPMRWERFYPRNKRNWPGNEYAFCLDSNDHTPHQSRQDYDPTCSYCWLGITHTQKLHKHRTQGESER